MKGTLHKTESGWQVWYHAKEDLYFGNTGVRILPLHPDDTIGIGQEENEIEFEIIEFPVPPTNGPVSNSINKYAKLVDYSWIKMKEGDITVNFKPIPEFDDPKYPEVKIICPRCKALMPCECNPPRQISLLDSVRANPSWDTIIREFHLATQQVPIGAPPLIFECWLIENYNPPTKK